MLLVLVVLTYVPLLQTDCQMLVTDRDRKNATHHKAGRHFGRPVGPVTGRRKLDGCGGRRDRDGDVGALLMDELEDEDEQGPYVHHLVCG